VWCNDYQDAMQQMEAAGVDRLLALTGVQTIGKLAPFGKSIFVGFGYWTGKSRCN
jgi:hypothetical protein